MIKNQFLKLLATYCAAYIIFVLTNTLYLKSCGPSEDSIPWYGIEIILLLLSSGFAVLVYILLEKITKGKIVNHLTLIGIMIISCIVTVGSFFVLPYIGHLVYQEVCPDTLPKWIHSIIVTICNGSATALLLSMLDKQSKIAAVKK